MEHTNASYDLTVVMGNQGQEREMEWGMGIGTF